MRAFWTSLALAIFAAPALANPVILAPSGTTLTTGQIRAETALSPGNQHGAYYWLVVGAPNFEANVIGQAKPGETTENMVSAQWSFLPETFITPAVAFGVRDMLSQSSDGIGGYVAATKHVAMHGLVPFFREFSATVGLGVAGIRGPFLGFETKLPFGIFAQGEYDSRDLNAAVGWQPVPLFRVKAYTIRSDFYFGAELLPVSF